MNKVILSEIKNIKDYNQIREEFKKMILQQKEMRRIHVGEYLTFLFENHDTVLYQIQEMMRAENKQTEKEILHEIETYNELIGEKDELGCTLLIEIPDKTKRDVLLSEWIGLPEKIYLETQSGKKIFAQFDQRQVGDRRISSVHYLKFKLGSEKPKKIGIDHSKMNICVELSTKQLQALAEDLGYIDQE